MNPVYIWTLDISGDMNADGYHSIRLIDLHWCTVLLEDNRLNRDLSSYTWQSVANAEWAVCNGTMCQIDFFQWL